MSSQQDNEILDIDIQEQVEHAIKMGEALKRLRDNSDFQTLILNGYLGEKIKASVSLLAVPQIKSQGRRPDIMEDLVAASNFEYFLMMVDQAYLGATEPVLSDAEEAEIAAQNDGAGAH